jgi:hypothetical protein
MIMLKTLKDLFDERVKKLLLNGFEKVNEINRKYSKPRIKMTRMVKLALLLLRVYLVTLVLILMYKFYTLVKA